MKNILMKEEEEEEEEEAAAASGGELTAGHAWRKGIGDAIKLMSAMLVSVAVSCGADGERLHLVAGSYADKTAPGIFVYEFNPDNGRVNRVGETSGIANPSFLALAPDGKHLYSVSETDDDSASVHAFRMDGDRGPIHLNAQLTGGASPCHVSVEPAGRFLVAANYTGGSITVFPLAADGSIAPATQKFGFDDSIKSHLHCTVFSPDGKFLFATDLGKDRIYGFRVTPDDNPRLTLDSSVELEKGSGPRHLVFHPSGKYAYVINELAGTVTAMRYDNGSLLPFQYALSDTTSGKGGKGSADIRISPDGRFLYSSNRLKADGIAIFSISSSSGALTRIGNQPTGAHPRNFILSPDGQFLLVASRDRNDVETFRRNPDTGLLENSVQITGISKPVCLVWGIGYRV
ncbi:MAG: lactonase family protein [Prevotellaceae bacterium]|jgi:6-phosphogluconolactonase (cycloisomerase 2 family)|nr:lactonase family protein [Prevotellaceae bacterium]